MRIDCNSISFLDTWQHVYVLQHRESWKSLPHNSPIAGAAKCWQPSDYILQGYSVERPSCHPSGAYNSEAKPWCFCKKQIVHPWPTGNEELHKICHNSAAAEIHLRRFPNTSYRRHSLSQAAQLEGKYECDATEETKEARITKKGTKNTKWRENSALLDPSDNNVIIYHKRQQTDMWNDGRQNRLEKECPPKCSQTIRSCAGRRVKTEVMRWQILTRNRHTDLSGETGSKYSRIQYALSSPRQITKGRSDVHGIVTQHWAGWWNTAKC
jgi:hypothetical protein